MKKGLQIAWSVIAGALLLTGCTLDGGDQNSKLTRYIGNEYVPVLADKSVDLVDNSCDTGITPSSVPTKLASFSPSVRPLAYGSSGSISLPHYYQETSYWCGPASAQMVQYYFSMGCSQSRIASYCGTTSSYGTSIYSLANWFNDSPMTGYRSLPSWWKWEVEYLDSYQEFLDCMGLSFYNYKAPEIWNVCTYPSSTYRMPGYTRNCYHYVAGKGYNSTYAIYNDPWYGSGGGPGKTVGKYTMYYCIKANKGLIIY